MINIKMPKKALEIHSAYCFNELSEKIGLEKLNMRDTFEKLIMEKDYKALIEISEKFGTTLLREDLKECDEFSKKVKELQEELKIICQEKIEKLIRSQKKSKKKTLDKVTDLCEPLCEKNRNNLKEIWQKEIEVESSTDFEIALEKWTSEFINSYILELNCIFAKMMSSREYKDYRNSKDDFIHLCKNLGKSEEKDLKEKWDNVFRKLSESEQYFLTLYEKFNKIKKDLGMEITKGSFYIRNKKGKLDIDNLEPKYWCSYLYTYLLGVDVCPYCNSQFVYTYRLNKLEEEDFIKSSIPNGTTRAELDHFFPKNKFPFLAMSIFNLVPSCHTCNSSIKGYVEFDDKMLEKINLYSEDIISDKFKFRVRPTKEVIGKIGDEREAILKCMLGQTSEIEFYLEFTDEKDVVGNECIKYYLDFFHISKRYEYFKIHILENINYKVSHPRKYMQNLIDEFKIKEPIIYSQYDYKNRLLGKLLDDLGEQFGFEFEDETNN